MKCSQLTGIAICAMLLAGCGFSSEKKEEPKKESAPVEAPKLVGRIASIPMGGRFVLIESYGTWKMEAGALLTTRGPEERSANLLVTGESLGQFAAADVQSGPVEIGDAVYSRHAPKPVEGPTEEPAPDLPSQN